MTSPTPANDAAPVAPSSPARAAAPRSTFALGAWLFLRLLAVVHLIAFVSFWIQLEGLVGPRGLLPATRYFAAIREQLGSTGAAFAQLPTLCWFFGSETFLHVLCAAGVALALLVLVGVAQPVCLFLLWAAYLSLNYAGQIFFNFQWDTLLLETTLLAIFLAPWRWLPLWRLHDPPRLGRWLLWWLLFRLMFLSGYVKLASGDSTWRDLTALTFHYETQPLPTPLGWFAHQLPREWHRLSCAVMFVLELVIPFLLFAPRVPRHLAALLLLALMAVVALTGNYTFFNLLAAALCLPCLDDTFLTRLLPARLRIKCHVIRDTLPGSASPQCNVLSDTSPSTVDPAEGPRAPAPASSSAPVPVPVFALSSSRVPVFLAAPFALFVFLFTLVQAFGGASGFHAVARKIAPFRSLNSYGLFAVMTNPRPELIFEGSHDGRTWEAYEFPHKPGALDRRPTWVAPHQPRLDWQLWFAALGALEHNRWVLSVCEHLLRGTPEVLALLDHNPFREKPPRFVRVVRYEYHFTDAATRATTGHWWRRTPIDFYVPSASLK